jgi:pSer/pThr/pTyr-binding forkhead associated (FHA) protein
MLAIQIHDDEGGVTAVPLHDGTISIGRREDADIRLTDRNVSREHARLTREGEKVWVEDAGARFGTYVNGERLSPRERVPLGPGDIVGIGYFNVELTRDAAGAAATDEIPAATPVAEGGMLELESELADQVPPPAAEPAAADEDDDPVPPLIAAPTPPVGLLTSDNVPPPFPQMQTPEKKKGKGRKKGRGAAAVEDDEPPPPPLAPAAKPGAQPTRDAAGASAKVPKAAVKAAAGPAAPLPEEEWYDDDLPEERSSSVSALVVLLVVLLLGAALIYAYYSFFRPEAQIESTRLPETPSGLLPEAPARTVAPAAAPAPPDPQGAAPGATPGAPPAGPDAARALEGRPASQGAAALAVRHPSGP